MSRINAPNGVEVGKFKAIYISNYIFKRAICDKLPDCIFESF